MDENHVPTILVVEDDPQTREYQVVSLQGAGYRTLSAGDGVEAMAILQDAQQSVDLVLCDILMPNMDGYEFCAKVKQEEQHGDVPFVFVSILSSLEEKLKGYAVGGDDYVTKSTAPEELVGKVKSLLNIRKRNCQLKLVARESQQAALAAMAYSSDLGRILGFINDVLQASSFAALSERLFELTRELGLRATIQYQTGDGPLSFGDNGEISPLESNVIELARRQSRFFDFGARTIVNYPEFSLLIKNMPVDNPEKYGQLKDTLGSLCNAIEAKVKNLLSIDASERRRAIGDAIQSALDDINRGFNYLQAANNAAILNMIDEIDRAVMHLGLTDYQEADIHAIAHACLERTQEIFDESRQLGGKFKDVKTTIDEIMKTGM